jgi:hypothetical protein
MAGSTSQYLFAPFYQCQKAVNISGLRDALQERKEVKQKGDLLAAVPAQDVTKIHWRKE